MSIWVKGHMLDRAPTKAKSWRCHICKVFFFGWIVEFSNVQPAVILECPGD